MSEVPPRTAVHAVDIHVGQRLRIQRRAAGLSQEALADASGITFQQVQKYERGANRVSASRLFEFATALRVPVSFFFEGLTDPVDLRTNDPATDEQTQLIQTFMATNEGVALARSFLSIRSFKTRRKIVALVRELSEVDDGASPDEDPEPLSDTG